MIEGLIIDSFAGGGGASTGIELAFERAFQDGQIGERRFVDYAINHDAEAISMHRANHPNTEHLPCNIWQVEFDQLVAGRKVGLMWFSPDCKHFSKAKGGKPVKKNIRDLAWVVIKAARQVRPAVIMLENVEEFQGWGPLVFRTDADGKVVNDPATGQPQLMPCPKRKGQTFRKWMAELRRLGYRAEWKELRACDYGAPTIRKRFFMIARRDGQKIAWPDQTHGDPKSDAVKNGELKPWRTAAEIIDWSLECPSIFLTPEEVKLHLERTGQRVKRPLAPATEDRVAKGVDRYVIKAEHPFIVNLVAAFLAQHNISQGEGHPGHSVTKPVSTILHSGSHQGLAAVHMMDMHGSDMRDAPADSPLRALTAGGYHAAQVAAFLVKYYGTDQDPDLSEPLHTGTTKDRFALVTVEINGQPYIIVDIGLRMLIPRELFRAQGFPEAYIIDKGLVTVIHREDGREWVTQEWVPLTKTAQVRMCGNSVCPQVAEALVRANLIEETGAFLRSKGQRVESAMEFPLWQEDAA